MATHCQHQPCFCEQSDLKAEPAPQRAADLQAGLTALVAVGTQHIQLTHLTIDLRGPHAACVQDSRDPWHPAWHQGYFKAALISLVLTGLQRTNHESLCFCQICPTPSRKVPTWLVLPPARPAALHPVLNPRGFISLPACETIQTSQLPPIGTRGYTPLCYYKACSPPPLLWFTPFPRAT